MQYSPKLKAAMEDIKQILNKYDIAGIVVIHEERGFIEYLRHLSSSYSCVKIAPNGGIRVRSKLQEDFAGNKEEQKRVVMGTSGMMHGLTSVAIKILEPIVDLSHRIDDQIGATHTDEGTMGHTEISN